MPGSGKSQLLKLLGKHDRTYAYFDLDECIVQFTQNSITQIFTDRGEDYFRNLEFEILKTLVANPRPTLIACGGGTVTFVSSLQLMVKSGFLIWLDVPIQTLYFRLVKDHFRPLIGEVSVEKLQSLYDSREQFYRTAHFKLDGAQKPERLANQFNSLLARIHDRK